MLNVHVHGRRVDPGVGYLLPLIYLLWSLRYGKRAGPNPWDATGLEWQTPSPPPPHNFDEHAGRDRADRTTTSAERRDRLPRRGPPRTP